MFGDPPEINCGLKGRCAINIQKTPWFRCSEMLRQGKLTLARGPGLFSPSHLLFQIIDKVLRAFLCQHLARLVPHVRFWQRALSSSRCASVIIGSSIVAPVRCIFHVSRQASTIKTRDHPRFSSRAS
jgi:hypothetical protein